MQQAVRVNHILFSLILIGTCSAIALGQPASLRSDSCFTCHAELWGDEGKSTDFVRWDVHLNAGIGCADCHGGDPTTDDIDESMNFDEGFLGAPATTEIPEFCARCHSDPSYMKTFRPDFPTDQLNLYRTSHHGQRLLEEGDDQVAQCVSCHGNHGIREVSDVLAPTYPTQIPHTCGKCHSDPILMRDYGIRTDQVTNYSKSIHGVTLLEKGDRAAPACNTCHGNHGAAPPGVESIEGVCGSCHALNAALFHESPLRSAFESAGLHSCAECHRYHDIQQFTSLDVGMHDGSVCSKCHSADRYPAGFLAAGEMRKVLDQSEGGYLSAETLMAAAESKGMEVSEGIFALQTARQNLFLARTHVHGFNLDALKEVASQADEASDEALTIARAALADFGFRQKWLLAATLIITAVLVSLYLKLRQIEARQKKAL